MTAFVAFAVTLALLAAALLARPLWWRSGASGRSGGEVDELARQLRLLAELHRAGTLGADPYAEAKARVERKLLASIAGAAEPGPAEPAAASAALVAGLALFMVAVAGAGYVWLGSPDHLALGPGSGGTGLARSDGDDAAGSPGQAASAPHALAPDQVAAMVDRLAERLKANPQDGEGWLMLARSQVVLGRHAQAVEAFKEAARLRPDDANLFADYADSRAMTQGRSLEGEPMKLVERALELDAGNPKALALAGTASFDRRDYAGAVRYWERLVQVEPDDVGYVQQIRGSIAEARQLAGLPPADASAAAAGASAPVASARISGTVELTAPLKGRVSPDDTVFVFARAVEGPRMPLAILRKQVRDLPLQFTLGDEMAMSPDARLSGASRVLVGARISKSGNAQPQSGDLQGLLGPVAVGSSGLKVEINQEVTR